MNRNKRMEVLCLDDNKNHLEIICDKVEEKLHTVYGAINVADAFKILEEKEIDCIVSDYELPDDCCNGIEFYLQARKKGYKNSIIFITSKKDIFKDSKELPGDVRVVFKESLTYGPEMAANIHNCYCKRLKETTNSYWF